MYDQLRAELTAATNGVSPPSPRARALAPPPVPASTSPDLSMVTRQTHADVRVLLLAVERLTTEVAVIRSRLGA